MNRIDFLWLALCALVVSAVPVSARSSMDTVGWLEGRFDMPPEIKKITDISELQPVLDNRMQRSITRMAAVRRLGEISGQKAVPELVRRFAEEPYYAGMEPRQIYVKLEIIRVLNHVGGQDAKSALLQIAQTYLEKGPQCRCAICATSGPYGNHDSHYSYVLRDVFRALRRWADDKAVLDLSQRVALDNGMRKAPIARLGAWELYLTASMAKQGKTTEQERAMYLVDFLAPIAEKKGIQVEAYDVEGKFGVRTLESIQTEAVRNLAREFGEATASHLEAERKNPGAPAIEGRGPAYSYIIGTIKQSVKEKEAEQKQPAP